MQQCSIVCVSAKFSYNSNKSTYSNVQSGSLRVTCFKVDIYRPEFQTTVCSSSKPPTHNNRTIKTLCLQSIHCKQFACKSVSSPKKTQLLMSDSDSPKSSTSGNMTERLEFRMSTYQQSYLWLVSCAWSWWPDSKATQIQQKNNKYCPENGNFYQNSYVSTIFIRLCVSQDF